MTVFKSGGSCVLFFYSVWFAERSVSEACELIARRQATLDAKIAVLECDIRTTYAEKLAAEKTSELKNLSNDSLSLNVGSIKTPAALHSSVSKNAPLLNPTVSTNTIASTKTVSKNHQSVATTCTFNTKSLYVKGGVLDPDVVANASAALAAIRMQTV